VTALASQLELELLIQLILAVVLGGVIGIERELKGKPAGLRTNVLICIGAVLFTELSLRIAAAGPGDPSRIASQILTGVGFIGAGTILHTRGSVSGLTSAATIWVVAAIGMAIGSRAYASAVGTTALVAIVLTGLGRVERTLGRARAQTRLIIHVTPDAAAFADLQAIVERTGLAIQESECRQENADLVVEMVVAGPKRLHAQAMVAITHHPLVRSVSTGE
jgi:putative Mg2+ transporter-C (MgtC) family protein